MIYFTISVVLGYLTAWTDLSFSFFICAISIAIFVALLEEGLFGGFGSRKFYDSVVDQISHNQNHKSQELQGDGSSAQQFPLIVRIFCSCADCDNQTDSPDQNCSGYISDGSGQSVNIFCHSDSCDIESGNREYSQNAEESQSTICTSFVEIAGSVLHVGDRMFIEYTSSLAETAWNEVKDRCDEDIKAQSEQSFPADDLERLQVIFVEEFLLVDKEESIEDQWPDDEDISNNLQWLNNYRKFTGSVALEDPPAKIMFDSPTIKTPTKASTAPITCFL